MRGRQFASTRRATTTIGKFGIQPKQTSPLQRFQCRPRWKQCCGTISQRHWKQNAAGYLFPNPSGTHPRRRDNVVKNGLKPLLRRLGIPCAARVGLHAFRHGLATELVESNVPLPIVQKQLRHADVTTTLRIYSHVVADTHRDVMERLGRRSISTNVPISTANFAN